MVNCQCGFLDGSFAGIVLRSVTVASAKRLGRLPLRQKQPVIGVVCPETIRLKYVTLSGESYVPSAPRV